MGLCTCSGCLPFGKLLSGLHGEKPFSYSCSFHFLKPIYGLRETHASVTLFWYSIWQPRGPSTRCHFPERAGSRAAVFLYVRQWLYELQEADVTDVKPGNGLRPVNNVGVVGALQEKRSQEFSVILPASDLSLQAATGLLSYLAIVWVC